MRRNKNEEKNSRSSLFMTARTEDTFLLSTRNQAYPFHIKSDGNGHKRAVIDNLLKKQENAYIMTKYVHARIGSCGCRCFCTGCDVYG